MSEKSVSLKTAFCIDAACHMVVAEKMLAEPNVAKVDRRQLANAWARNVRRLAYAINRSEVS